MKQISTWVLSVSIFLITHMASSVDNAARFALVQVLTELSNNNNGGQLDPSFGWNSTSDPCNDNWKGVVCDDKTNNSSVRKLLLNDSNLSGTFNAAALCSVQSLSDTLKVLNFSLNKIGGVIHSDIASCKQISHLLVGGNNFSGNLPDSLAMLSNLKQIDISNNRFSGDLPGLTRVSGLNVFLAQNNRLTGEIPEFDFSNLEQFNVSNNLLRGPIPDDANGKFIPSCYLGNPDLCGDLIDKKCPKRKSKGVSKDQILMFSGYIALGLVIIALTLCILFIRRKRKGEKVVNVPTPKKVASSVDDDHDVVTSAEFRTDVSRSVFSVNSTETTLVSSSLVVLTSPTVSELKFEDLLSAPAELLGRGRRSSLYRVNLENGMVLAVKRIKDWAITTDEFKQRMQRLEQAKHPNVLPTLAFYCSNHEKLLVYEYQPNGSLFILLHGNQKGQRFEWTRRLGIAAKIADALAFMYQELRGHAIGHGNLKSSNIMLKNDMEPCISEYGLVMVDPQESSSSLSSSLSAHLNNVFSADIYGFGVILLELLTGKQPVQQNDGGGGDLASWVRSVVREEWTAEVFDKSLISEGAREESMLNLLQVAMKCVDISPEGRPSINQVATMINAIKEEEVEEEDNSLVDEEP